MVIRKYNFSQPQGESQKYNVEEKKKKPSVKKKIVCTHLGKTDK